MKEFNNENNMENSTSLVEINEHKDAKIENMELQLRENNLKMDFISKIQEIDNIYQKGASEYTETIHRYNLEIEQLKSDINLKNSKNKKEEKDLLDIENELSYTSRHFETLHNKFNQKLHSINELSTEYKEVLSKEKYNETLIRKEREIFELVDEIEELELTLLKHELQRINIASILSKKQKVVELLESELKEVELKKSYFESIGLKKVTPLQLEGTPVETEVLD